MPKKKKRSKTKRKPLKKRKPLNKRKVTKKRKNKTRKKQKGGNIFLDVITHPSLTHLVIAVGAYLIGHYFGNPEPVVCPEAPPCFCQDDPYPYSI